MSFDEAKSARWVKRQIADHRQYVQRRNEEGIPNEARRDLIGYAEGAKDLATATIALTMLSAYEGALGCLMVLDGDPAGWTHVDRTCLYKYWEVRLLVGLYDVSTDPAKRARATLLDASLAWIHAEARGARGMTEWLDDRFRRVHEGNGALAGKGLNPLVGLVAYFATGHDEAALAAAGWAELGPYGAVARGTFSSTGYDDLAEYHRSRASGAGVPEFEGPPFTLVPFELLAMERRLGVPIRNAKHPLLATSLAQRRTAILDVPADLKAVIERASGEVNLT